MKPAAAYTRICGTIPSTLQVDGNMGLDANDDFIYFRVGGPETADLSRVKIPARLWPALRQTTSGLRGMNLKTGEIKSIVNVGFGIGHVQTNPWMPGEIVFCWETGRKLPNALGSSSPMGAACALSIPRPRTNGSPTRPSSARMKQ